jgi:hypothetical protein
LAIGSASDFPSLECGMPTVLGGEAQIGWRFSVP